MAQRHMALRATAARQGEDIHAARRGGFFPLTPALSPGERVTLCRLGAQSRPVGFPRRDARSSLPRNLPLSRPSAFAKPTADKSGTLSPSEGERDGVRGPLAGSGAQCAHKVRRILALRERVRVRGDGANYHPAYRLTPGNVELCQSSGGAGG